MVNEWYEVWGQYSPEQYQSEFLEEFDNLEDAKAFVAKFEEIQGQYAWIKHIIGAN
jgi:hypothetical protein